MATLSADGVPVKTNSIEKPIYQPKTSIYSTPSTLSHLTESFDVQDNVPSQTNVTRDSALEFGEDDDGRNLVPTSGDNVGDLMWTWNHIGLYAHYAGVGFNGGIAGLCLNFCFYYFRGAENLCPNSQNIIFIPWSFKVFYAMFTDSFRPFGMRRKPYMIAGWIGVLLFTLLLAITAPEIGSQGWILLSVGSMVFLMLADVPADGYSVEMGQLESEKTRGQILATGQIIRFTCTIIAGFIQALLVNGPTTNPPGCSIAPLECWEWGLTVAEYYGLIFCILFVLFIPIIFLKEMDGSQIPKRTFNEHRLELWETLQNRTTLYLLVFVTGANCFSSLTNITSTYLQYEVIGLTNLQSGIDSITTYLALTVAIWLFKRYLLNRNWRITQYGSNIFTALLGMQWLIVIYGVCLNPWFTIFINTNQVFAQGITQVLFAMAVIELAKPGQESITYELVISTSNAAGTINSIVATQLLGTMQATACTDPSLDDNYYAPCTSNQVDVYGKDNYFATDGPTKFANYTYLILGINIAATLLFTPFLPKQKAECHEWRKKGEEAGANRAIGYASILVAVVVIGYGIIASVILMVPATSCLPAFGGDGC